MHQLQPPLSLPSPPTALALSPHHHPGREGGGCGALPGSFGLLANERGRLLVALWVCALVRASVFIQVQANPGRRNPTTPPPRPLPQIPFLSVGAGGLGALSRIHFWSNRAAKGVNYLGLTSEGRSPSRPSPAAPIWKLVRVLYGSGWPPDPQRQQPERAGGGGAGESDRCFLLNCSGVLKVCFADSSERRLTSQGGKE